MNCCWRLKYSNFLRKDTTRNNFRAQVVKSALNSYDKILEKDENDIEPVYRNRNWKKIERVEDKKHIRRWNGTGEKNIMKL